MTRILFASLACVLLAACGGPSPARHAGYAGSHHAGLSCAPFARELSGLALYGDAADWWEAAEGRYRRASRPEVGGVLVFRREPRLASGHVSVVSELVGPRQVRVTQANWVPGELDEDQLVVDVSEDGDWSLVRVWYPPVDGLGAHSYPTYGFILPARPTTREVLARGARPAVARALSARRS